MAVALPQEIFLSHSANDREFINKLANAIRRHGLPVWYSQTNILGAQQWHDEIGDALQRCDCLDTDQIDPLFSFATLNIPAAEESSRPRPAKRRLQSTTACHRSSIECC